MHDSIIPLVMELKLSGIEEKDFNELDREWRKLRNIENLTSMDKDAYVF